MTQLVRPVLDGERHGHGPHPETCQQGDRQLDHVGELDPDRVAGPDARRLQFSDGTVDASIDLGPCEPLGHAAIERGPIRASASASSSGRASTARRTSSSIVVGSLIAP